MRWFFGWLRPFRITMRTALANPVQSHELEVLLRDRLQNDVKLMDYIAKRHAEQVRIEIQQIIDQSQTTIDIDTLLPAILGSPQLLLLIQQQVDAARVVESKVIEKKTVTRDRWHIEKMFSWIGALIGMIAGAIIGVLLNNFVNSDPLVIETIGKQIIIDSWIDSPPTQIIIVAVLAIAGGLLGGTLFGRRDKN